MSAWPVQDAKSRFSELLDVATAKGPQIITRRGVETAVIVSIEEWRRIGAQPRRSLKELLLAPEPRIDLAPYLPKRGRLAVALRPADLE